MTLVNKTADHGFLRAKRPKVVVADMLNQEAKLAAADITRRTSRRCSAIPTSAVRRNWKTAVNATIAEFGKLDVLVNDAGISVSAADSLFGTPA